MPADPIPVPVQDATQLETAIRGYIAKGWQLTFRGLGVAVLLNQRSFRGDRVVAVTLPGAPWEMSEDGQWWWDGQAQAWKGCDVEVPPGVARSEDGRFWWDGARWRAVPDVDVDTLL